MITLDDIRSRVTSAPQTPRAQRAHSYLRIIDCYINLLQAMLEYGLEDRHTSCKPNFVERLRRALERSTFTPPNAKGLLEDLHRAHKGNRKAQERIIDYLSLPGVIEALGDD